MADFSDILDHGRKIKASDLLSADDANAVRMTSSEGAAPVIGGEAMTLSHDSVTLADAPEKSSKDKRAMRKLTKSQRAKLMKKAARAGAAAGHAISRADAMDSADSLDDAWMADEAESVASRIGAAARRTIRARRTAHKGEIGVPVDAGDAALKGSAGTSATPAADRFDAPQAARSGPSHSASPIKERKDARARRITGRTERKISALTRSAQQARIPETAAQGARSIASRIHAAASKTFQGAAVGTLGAFGAIFALIAILAMMLTVIVTVLGYEQTNDDWGFEGLTDNERIVAVYLKEKGLDKIHVAAIMGNISAECNFDPEVIEQGSALGVGIFQWPTTTDGSHGQRMKAYVESTGRHWGSIYGQLDFAWYEISGDDTGLPGHPGDFAGAQWMWNYEQGCIDFLAANSISRSPGPNLERWNAVTSIEVATEYFTWGFLRPATSTAHIDHRIEEAKRYLAILQGPGSGDISSIVTDPVRKQILSAAASQLGVPYVWGGTTPGVGLDCSGLTQYAYAQAGISIPRVSEDQMAAGTCLPVSQAQPGDILWKQGHVAIFVEGDTYIHAPYTGARVRMDQGIDYFTYTVRF